MAESLSEVDTYNPVSGSILHVGDVVCLSSLGSRGCLAVDVNEEVRMGYPESVVYSVVTSAHKTACIRNALHLNHACNNADSHSTKDSLIHYGDKITLSFEFPRGGRYYLHSELLTPTSTSKISRRQCVTAAPSVSGRDETWEILPADNRERVRAVVSRRTVSRSDEFSLRHVATGCLLASDSRHVQHNVFGREFEVCCHSEQSRNKSQNLNNERRGFIDGTTPTRMSVAETAWTVCG